VIECVGFNVPLNT